MILTKIKGKIIVKYKEKINSDLNLYFLYENVQFVVNRTLPPNIPVVIP